MINAVYANSPKAAISRLSGVRSAAMPYLEKNQGREGACRKNNRLGSG